MVLLFLLIRNCFLVILGVLLLIDKVRRLYYRLLKIK
nr:MAG TPA: hypothetical protein [Crassvirales sp.]DAK71222.1 MAG TPA: hypothetical protein [Caudoviricetes sp.]DAP79206.1 MAG TPA: hypothetical protein [Caudoviricetes sp.]